MGDKLTDQCRIIDIYSISLCTIDALIFGTHSCKDIHCLAQGQKYDNYARQTKY